jgi:adenylosuccinate lyase
MQTTDVYDNPLVTRYASRPMAELWGPQRKFSTWRRLWLALAESQYELGLKADDGVTPRITPSQLDELRAHLDDIDFARAAALERRLRHDVMAHIQAWAEVCPNARAIIHLGATSCFVTDNTDLILMREGLRLLRDQVVGVIDSLAVFAERWRALPTVAYTHFQPAQLTTVGKRACLWGQDLIFDLEEVERRLSGLRLRGVKGTTGTQASFLTLFQGDHDKVRQLDERVARKMGFDSVYPVTGQTYSRKIDSQVLDTLSGLGQSAHKFGTDLRLLAHEQEVEEPFEAEQVGSSAMAYKRNPMRAERMCGLARTIMSLAANTAQTAATQWLERTLDDSVNRRLTLPQAFLAADGVMRLWSNIVNGLVVNPVVVARNVDRVWPFMATENVLMEAVAQGGDRQLLHEVIRRHSVAVADELKAGALTNDLIDRLRKDPHFAGIDWGRIQEGYSYTGRAAQQVEEWLHVQVEPIRQRYATGQRRPADVDF